MKTIRVLMCALILSGCGSVIVTPADAGPCPVQELPDSGIGPGPTPSTVSSFFACSVLATAANDRDLMGEEFCPIECPWPVHRDVRCNPAKVEACYAEAVTANFCSTYRDALEECDPTACQ